MVPSVLLVGDSGGGYICFQYNAPSVLLEAVALMVLFAKIEVGNRQLQKIIMIFSQLVFGVYVLHSNCIFREVVGWRGRWTEVARLPSWEIVVRLIEISVVVYALGLIVDYCRLKVFSTLKSWGGHG